MQNLSGQQPWKFDILDVEQCPSGHLKIRTKDLGAKSKRDLWCLGLADFVKTCQHWRNSLELVELAGIRETHSQHLDYDRDTVKGSSCKSIGFFSFLCVLAPKITQLLVINNKCVVKSIQVLRCTYGHFNNMSQILNAASSPN